MAQPFRTETHKKTFDVRNKTHRQIEVNDECPETGFDNTSFTEAVDQGILFLEDIFPETFSDRFRTRKTSLSKLTGREKSISGEKRTYDKLANQIGTVQKGRQVQESNDHIHENEYDFNLSCKNSEEIEKFNPSRSKPGTRVEENVLPPDQSGKNAPSNFSAHIEQKRLISINLYVDQ